jgi:hypothetical protein
MYGLGVTLKLHLTVKRQKSDDDYDISNHCGHAVPGSDGATPRS